MPKSNWLRHKNVLRRHLSKYWPKNAQISKSDINKPQNWETCRYFIDLKFLKVKLS